MICIPKTLLMHDMWFPSRLDDLHIPDAIFHQPFSRHKFCDFAQLLSFLITENYMWPLIYSPVQFPATKSNLPLAVDLRNCDYLGHYSTFVPFPKQSSANCSRWNITASSLIKSCCYIFQSLSSVCFHATKKNSVIPRSRFSSTPTSWQVFNVSSFSHPLKKFWIVLLLMPVIFCIL
jgi:hypothetical protein